MEFRDYFMKNKLKLTTDGDITVIYVVSNCGEKAQVLSKVSEYSRFKVTYVDCVEKFGEPDTDSDILVIDYDFVTAYDNSIVDKFMETIRVVDLPTLFLVSDELDINRIKDKISLAISDFIVYPVSDIILKSKIELFEKLSGLFKLVNKLFTELNEANNIYDAIERANNFAIQTELENIELMQVFNTTAGKQWVIDDDYKVMMINNSFVDFLGIKREDAIGKKCYDLFKCSICHTEQCTLKQIKIKKRTFCEADVNIPAAGLDDVFYIASGSPFIGAVGTQIGVIEEFKDITLRKKMENELEVSNKKLMSLATTDGLTKINNRRVFDDKLVVEWARMRRSKSPLTVIMCDVDHFKLYNDHYGHLKGDNVLYSVAQAINSATNRAADFVARFGGEEFVILLPETDIEGAVAVAHKIQKNVNSLAIEHSKSKTHSNVTITIGVATKIPDGEKGYSELVEQADQQLYLAKEAGRNRIYHSNLQCKTL